MINLYYCRGKNFGDRLNKYIFRYLLNEKVISSSFQYGKVIGIGSILQDFLFENSNEPEIKKCNEYIHCFSTGIHSEKDFEDLFEIKSLTFRKPIRFWAVRGKLTFDLLKKYGISLDDKNVVLGDAGLLVDSVFNVREDKIFDVGIVPHSHELKYGFFTDLIDVIPNSTILDVRISPKAFLKKLAQCKSIISTGLHPLIASDSLRIPNLWIRISENYARTLIFKFRDYYSSYGLKVDPLNIKEIDKNIFFRILDEYKISDELVDKKKSELLNAASLMKKDILDEHTDNSMVRKNIMHKLFIEFPYLICIFPKRAIIKLLYSIPKGHRERQYKL